MNNRFVTKMEIYARAFACAATLICYTLHGAEALYTPYFSRKTIVVDNYYMVLTNDKGTEHTSSDQGICVSVRTTEAQDKSRVWVPTEIVYSL